MDIQAPALIGASKAYWNSLTRFNVPVTVIGVNGDNYAVESDGHLFIVPKANVSPKKKIIAPIETTAPKPDGEYWLTLTANDHAELLKALATRQGLRDNIWAEVIRALSPRTHTGTYTNEWFCLPVHEATALLSAYSYDAHKHEKDINGLLPSGFYYKTVVRQLWEEQLRRDGITLR